MTIKPTTCRVQVYLSDPKVSAALKREARQGKTTLSRAARAAITRGLQRSLPADPEDRLLKLERGLRDHMQSMARDMTFTQELIGELARALFVRLPETPGDHDPLLKAAVEQRMQRFLDATAARLQRGVSMETAEEGVMAPARSGGRSRSPTATRSEPLHASQ